jgi:hypothetical protein
MLPNAKDAVVESAKVRDYLLSPVHPVGRYKAAVFHALGYVADDWRRLQQDLLALAQGGAGGAGSRQSVRREIRSEWYSEPKYRS